MKSFILKGKISDIIRQIKLMQIELKLKEYENWVFYPVGRKNNER